MDTNKQTAATLRALADTLDPPAAGSEAPADPFAGVTGPPAGVDPLDWARENPDAARAWALRITYAQVGGYSSTRDLEREARLAERDAADANRWLPGNFALDDPAVRDPAAKAWLGVQQATGRRDLRYVELIGGRNVDVSRYFHEADQLRLDRPDLAVGYNGPVRTMLERMLGEPFRSGDADS